VDCIELAQKLIRFKSVTPHGSDCLDFVGEYLKNIGFNLNRLPFEDVDNLYACKGQGSPHILFVGHVDVVPEGDGWQHNPYAAVIENDILYGRGAVDMKGSIAAFLSAVTKVKNFKGSISKLLTTDEEGPARNGVVKIIPWLQERGIKPDYALTGEPTSVTKVGDTIKNGRRGSISFEITVNGIQGHVAYPDLAKNPATFLVQYLHELKQIVLDNGTTNFDASNLEIVKLSIPNGANNVIPDQAFATVNIRFNTLHNFQLLEELLNKKALEILRDYGNGIQVIINPKPSAEPFLNNDHKWAKILQDAVLKVTGYMPQLSTSGGTSDARFVYNLCPVLELGLSNKTAHHKDECVAIEDLQTLEEIYLEVLQTVS
jgi:succinyl-diaminopimelate desuccinylase